MKKIPALLLCLIMILTACSSTTDPKETATDAVQETGTSSPFDNYIGDGLLQIFKNILDVNAYFATDVFYAKNLSADESTVIESGGIKYSPVISEKYKSYAELSAAVYSVYTDQAAKKILAEYSIYADINGVFCINTAKTRSTPYFIDWSNYELLPKEAGSEKCVVDVKLANGATFPATFVNINGNWRLDSFCTGI